MLGLFNNGEPTERHDLQVQHARVAGWRLEVRHDRFTNQTSCVIQKDHITYDHGVVTFALGSRVDTANATYRLDSGPVSPAGNVAVEAAGLGARFDSQNLANPSNGDVHIPARDLGAASAISIRANTRMTHRVFDLTGLSHAFDAARARNCDVP